MIKQFQHWQRLAPIHFITVASRTTICVLAAWLAVTASAQTPEQTADPLIQFERLMVQIEKKVFASVCNLDELQKKLTDWHPSGDLDKVMEVLAQKYAADLWKEFPETKAAADAYLQQYNPENIFLQSNGNNSDAEKISALQFMAGLNEEAKEQGASPAGAMLLTVMESCRQTMVQMFDDEIFTPLKFRSQFSGEAGGIQQQTKSPETLYAGKDKVSLPSEDSGEKSCNDCLIPQSAFDEGLRKWKKMRAVQTIPSLAMHAQVSWVYEFHKLGVQSVADKATSIVDHKLFRCRSEVECDRSLLGLKKLAETAPQILLEPEIEQTWAKDVQEIKHPTSRRKWVYLFSALTLEAEFNAKIKLGSWDHIGIYVGNGAGASANQISVAWLKDYRSRSQALRQNTELHPFLSAPQIAQAKQNNDAYAETYWTFAYVNKDSQDFDEGGFLFGLSESEAELFPQAFPEDQRMGLIERMRTWNHELLQRTETLRALELYSLRLESKKPYQYLEQMFALLQSEQEKGIGAYWALLSEKFSLREAYLPWGHLWHKLDLRIWQAVADHGPTDEARYLFRRPITEQESKVVERMISEKYSAQTEMEKLLLQQILAYDPQAVSNPQGGSDAASHTNRSPSAKLGEEPGIRGLKRNLVYAPLHPMPGLHDGSGWFKDKSGDFAQQKMSTEDKEAWFAENLDGFESFMHLYRKSLKVDGQMQATVQSMQAIPVTQKKRIQQKVDQIDDLFAQHLASIADMACLGLQFTPRQKMQSSKVYLYQWKAYLDSLPADIKTLEFGEGHQKIKVDLGTVCGPGINPPAGWRSREFLRASLDRMYWEGSKDNALKSLHVLHSFWVSKATEPFVHAASRLTLAGVLGLRTSYGVSTTVLRAQRARRIHNRYRMAKVASDIAGVTVGSIAFAEIHYHSLRLAVGQTHKRELGKEYLMGAAIFWVMPRVQNLFLRGGQYLRGWARLGKNSKIDVSRVKMDMRRFGRMDTYHKFESWQEASYFMSARVLADTFTFGSLPYIERAGGKAWGYTSVQLGNLMLAENEKVPYEYGDPVFQGDIGDNLWSGFETGAGFYVFGKLAGRWGMHKQKRSMLREYKRRTLATNHLRRQLANDFPAFAALSTREKAQKITEKDLSALWQAHRQKVYDDSGLITPDGTARKKVEQDLAEVLEVPLDLVYRAGVPLAEMKIRRLYETINPAEVYTPPGPDATLGSKHPGMDLRKIVNEAHEIIKQVQHSKTQNPSEEGMQDHVHHAAEDIRFIYDKIIELRIQGYMHLKRGGVDRKTKELYKALRRIKDEAETFHYGNHKHDSKNSTDTQELTL